MSTALAAISSAAGCIQAEAHDLCALGPALSADRLREGIGVIRLALASLERCAGLLERSEALAVPVHSNLGAWP